MNMAHWWIQYLTAIGLIMTTTFMAIQWEHDLQLQVFWWHQSMVDDPMDILYDNQWLSLSEEESLPNLESHLMEKSTLFGIRYNGSHHHASPLSHGDIWFVDFVDVDFDCQFVDFDWLILLIWLWLWLIDYNLMMIWWFWFDYNDLSMMMKFMIMMNMLMNNMLMPRSNPLRLASMGFTSWIDYYRWHSPPGLLCVLPLIERMFHYELIH